MTIPPHVREARRRSALRWACWLPALLALMLLSGCFWPEDADEPLVFALPTPFSSVPLAVGTQRYTVERGEVVRTFRFDGTVQAGTQRELYFPVSGPVVTLAVANGDQVGPGDLVIALESEGAELDLSEALLGYQQAELQIAAAREGANAALEVARLNLEITQLQLEKARWDPATPREDLAVAERQVDIAAAAVARLEAGGEATSVGVTLAQVQLQMAEIGLTRAQRALDRLQLRAPISGTVRLSQGVRVGYPVEAYAAVARIVETRSLLIESNLPAEDQAQLREGMPVALTLASLPGVTMAGTVSRLPQPYGSGTTPLTQILPELGGGRVELREGALVRIQVEVGRQEGVLWLPNAVIQTVAGNTYVVVREGEVVREQRVGLGLVGDARTEIVSGLSEGMVVLGP
jgi:multidrug efflux pump subunit AcrA (membrane-fusion protein)